MREFTDIKKAIGCADPQQELSEEWLADAAPRMLRDVVYAWVVQHPDTVKHSLMKTGTQMLVYTSYFDKCLGTGFDFQHSGNLIAGKWQGYVTVIVGYDIASVRRSIVFLSI